MSMDNDEVLVKDLKAWEDELIGLLRDRFPWMRVDISGGTVLKRLRSPGGSKGPRMLWISGEDEIKNHAVRHGDRVTVGLVFLKATRREAHGAEKSGRIVTNVKEIVDTTMRALGSLDTLVWVRLRGRVEAPDGTFEEFFEAVKSYITSPSPEGEVVCFALEGLLDRLPSKSLRGRFEWLNRIASRMWVAENESNIDRPLNIIRDGVLPGLEAPEQQQLLESLERLPSRTSGFVSRDFLMKWWTRFWAIVLLHLVPTISYPGPFKAPTQEDLEILSAESEGRDK